jgi:putative glutamine amidotransferase
MSAARPTVGVLCGRSPAERYSTQQGYIASVVAAGGLPLIIPAGPHVDPLDLTAMVDYCHALIITGGGDVDPDVYSVPVSAMSECLMDVDPSRDMAELGAAQYAMAQGKRVLGVCRGAQLLAVMGGGTLIIDLKEKGLDGHWDEDRQYEPVHDVRAEAGSLAAQVLGDLTRVNSIHHQAIADPGQLVRASAWSPDGVIEAVEGPGLLGVQWHPERLSSVDHRFLTPFTWVVGS